MIDLWKLIFLLAATLAAAPAQVGDTPATVFEHPLDKATDNETFVAVAARLRQIQVLRSDFSQKKTIAALRRPLRSSGQFLFSPEHGVWWHTAQPFQTTFVMTPHGIMEQSDDSEPFIIEAEQQPVVMGFSKVFMSLFNGDTSELEDRFELSFDGDENQWRLGLKPRGKIMQRLIDHIVLIGGDHIDTIHFVERSGDRTVIAFEEVTIQEPPLTLEEKARFAF